MKIYHLIIFFDLVINRYHEKYIVFDRLDDDESFFLSFWTEKYLIICDNWIPFKYLFSNSFFSNRWLPLTQEGIHPAHDATSCLLCPLLDRLPTLRSWASRWHWSPCHLPHVVSSRCFHAFQRSHRHQINHAASALIRDLRNSMMVYHTISRALYLCLCRLSLLSQHVWQDVCVWIARVSGLCCHHSLHAHDILTIFHQHRILPSINCPLRENEELFVDTPVCVSAQDWHWFHVRTLDNRALLVLFFIFASAL